ncbi:hypothetical protein ACQEVZ_46975 [Dactylosporangium sp. CA-152071]|uniref:hypothetical protein n=1 Tax=Dactylosporangium sp. CA-152071 TaxID=3239933 RepID=UPI003D9265FC
MTLAWRVTAILVAVSAAGYVVLDKFVIQPLTWRIEPGILGLYAGLIAFASTVAVPVLTFLWLTRRLRPRPATFTLSADLDRPAFVAAESPMYRGIATIVFMMMAANLIPTERVPDSYRMRLSTPLGFVPVLVVEAAVLAVFALALVWLPNSSVRLTPTGLTVRYLLGSRSIDWHDLFPGGPPPTVRRTMPLRYRGRTGRARQLDVLVYTYHVDREFLATVVRHYAERPEHRPDIGTQTELDRLRIGFQHRVRRPAGAVTILAEAARSRPMGGN